MEDDAILRDPQVRLRTGLSRVQRWRLIRAGEFPAPIQLGRNSIGWRESEVNAWVKERPRVHYAPVERESIQANAPVAAATANRGDAMAIPLRKRNA